MSTFKVPARFSMKVYVTDGDGVTGIADIDLPLGVYPTKDKINEWIKKAVEQTKRHDENFRLVTPTEFSETIAIEETGQSIRVVGCPEKWEGLTE